MAELLRVERIRKTFPGVVALDEVSFSIRPGEIHTLLGENGAGKSTLMNVLTGLYHPDSGRILVDGASTSLASPRDSLALGIGMVHQHFMLVPAHSVFENILLALDGVPPFLSRKKFRARIQDMLESFELGLDLDSPIWKLSIGAQQWIELVKLLMRDCRLLILDEPTAVLTPQESERLFKVLKRIRGQGKSVIFISHKMREVMAVSDRVTVLKKGRSLATLERGDFDEHKLASLMIGADRIPEWEKSAHAASEVVLSVRDLEIQNERGRADVHGLNFDIHKGEILGVAGIAGNGQNALAEVLTGLRQPSSGRILAGDEDITRCDARRSYVAGIAHVPEDRKAMGIAPDLPVADNLILKSYKKSQFCKGFFQNREAIHSNARDKIERFAIQCGPGGTPVRHLSGGNIQKVIIARELSERPRVLVALYPSRGLDMGAAEYVHQVIVEGSAEGMATLLISEDLDELLKLSDRLAVMFRGKVVGYADPGEATRERIGLMMSGEGGA